MDDDDVELLNPNKFIAAPLPFRRKLGPEDGACGRCRLVAVNKELTMAACVCD